MAHLGQLIIWLVNFLPGLGPWVATCQNIVNWSHQCAHYRTPIKPFLLMGESSSSAQLAQVFTVLTTRVKTLNLAKLFVRIKSFFAQSKPGRGFLSRNPLSGHFISWQKIATFLIWAAPRPLSKWKRLKNSDSATISCKKNCAEFSLFLLLIRS